MSRIVSRAEAVRFRNNENLFDATEWIIDERGGTPLHLRRRLSPELTKQLLFETKDGRKGPFFCSETMLDKQAIRGIRRLAPESAALFDRIIASTDRLPRVEQILVVTQEMLGHRREILSGEDFRLPEEIFPSGEYIEGSRTRIEVNRNERDARARAACIAKYGSACSICGFDFGKAYGAEATGYIHVHHLKPFHEIHGNYEVDPAADLRPVCLNCHAVLHLNRKCRTVDEVIAMLHSHRTSIR